MMRLNHGAIACAAVLLVMIPGAARQARAETYPKMLPIDQYLMPDRNAEIAMARSAAPPSISGDATVLVLGRNGYETAIKGKNGFVCLVERSWMSPFDFPEFWNAKMRGPICYNPPAARTVLTYTIARTKLVLAGKSKPEILAAIKTAVAGKALPVPEPGAMSYMMSRQGYLNDEARSWRPHLMFHPPKTDAAAWGANLAGSPVMLDSAHHVVPEPETIFMVGVDHWSDGTPAPGMDMHKH